MRIYIGGKMAGRPGDDVRVERASAADLCQQFGLAYYDPAANEIMPSGTGLVDISMTPALMQSFVTKDEWNLDRCTALLVLTGDTPSDGTWWEMARAYYYLQIPIVMVAPRRLCGAMGFSNFKVSAMFATQREAIAYIATNLEG